ncbi:MAG: hypothetical protein HY026_05095 [Deltaproteobacteria bacterium]|nr:hypothetical protein [Deltaproteobacteria bacterium]
MTIKGITIIIFTLLLLSFLYARAEAIPVFARKYKTSCVTCHTAFPKLNFFGEVFRRNGYQIPQVDERYVKEKPISLGAAAWKEVWPDGVWPGEIPGSVPFSLVGSALYRYDPDSKVKHDFIFPQEIDLLSAGTLGEDISFFGSIALIEDGNDFGGVERLFLRFDNLFNYSLPERFLNLTIGQFEPAVTPFSNHRRLTHTPYLFNIFEVGKDNFHFSDQRGIEIDGIVKSRVEYAAGVVNGNGAGKMDKSTQSLDNNSTKDAYFRVGYKFGGFGLDGSGIKTEEGTALPEVGTERSIYASALGYLGENRISGIGADDKFYRYGFTFDLNYDNINLFGAVIQGKHDNPRGDFKQTSVTSYFSEADLILYPWLIGILRYGIADMEHEQNKDEIVISLVALIRTNIKLIAEGALHTTGGESSLGLIRLDFAL